MLLIHWHTSLYFCLWNMMLFYLISYLISFLYMIVVLYSIHLFVDICLFSDGVCYPLSRLPKLLKYHTMVTFISMWDMYVTSVNTMVSLHTNNSAFISYWMLPELHCAWWRHQIEIFSALLAICAGNSPVTGEFPTQRPVTRGFDVFFDLHQNHAWLWCFLWSAPEYTIE